MLWGVGAAAAAAAAAAVVVVVAAAAVVAAAIPNIKPLCIPVRIRIANRRYMGPSE